MTKNWPVSVTGSARVRSWWCVADAAQRWVDGLRAGDPDVFDEVYDAYRARIFGYLLRLTQNRAEAEDLLQETWLRAARAARRLAPDSRLEAWLFRIAHNVFISHRRWARLDFARLTELTRRPSADAPPTPFETHAGSELQRRLEAALARLDVAQREVLVLVAVEGLEPAAAAAVLDVKPATLRQRLKRARDALAEALTDDELRALGRAPRAATSP